MDNVDIDLSWDGDLLIDQTSDLQSTSYDALQSIRNQITLRVKSDLRDWREDSNLGADLGDFIGEPNNSTTGKRIQERVQASVSDILSAGDVAVRVIPVGVSKVLINIRVQVLATPDNHLKAGDIITIDFAYDYFERGVFVPIDEMNKFGNRSI